MRHADDGTLRRLIDEPFAVPSDVKRHYEQCVRCQDRARAIADDARAVADAIAGRNASEAPSDDAAAAYARFVSRRSGSRPAVRVAALSDWARRPYAGVIGGVAAAAVLGLLLVFTPVGTLAQNFLTIFEPHQFVAINVSKGELQYLPDLDSFGTMAQQREPAHRQVATTAQATALTGVRVRMPGWLPPAVPHEMHVVAVSRGSASFTFSAAKARAYASAARKPMPPMPPGLDGSVLTLNVGPMVVIDYGKLPEAPRHSASGHTRGDEGPDMADLPPLAIVESAAPHLYSTGATAQQLQAYLLQMPGVSPQLAAEIRAIGDPSTTMPIPVPIDRAYSQNVVVDGANGLAIGDNTGVGGVILWQKNGIVYGVGGAMPQRQLMEIAQSLR